MLAVAVVPPPIHRGRIPETLSGRVSVEHANSSPQPAIPSRCSEDTLKDSIATQMWESLSFSRLDMALDYDRTELARTYAESYQQLEQASEELAKMWAALREQIAFQRCDQRVTLHNQEECRRTHRAMIDELIRVTLVPADEALTAQSVVRPGLQVRLLNSLRRAIRTFVASLFDDLERMTQHKVVGTLTWTSPVDCCFTAYRHGLSVEFIADQSSTSTESSPNPRRMTLVTGVRQTTHNTFSRVEHEHHLMDAQLSSLDLTIQPIPLPIQSFVESLPAWLKPAIRVVEGTQIRERIREEATSQTVWTAEPHEVRRTEVNQVVFRGDPAIVLGRYVLLAWGHREVEAELQRLDELRTESEAAVASKRRRSMARRTISLMKASEGVGIGLSLAAILWPSLFYLLSSWTLGVLAVILSFVAASSVRHESGKLDIGAGAVVAIGRLLRVIAVQALIYTIVWRDVQLGLVAGICTMGALANHRVCQSHLDRLFSAPTNEPILDPVS